MNRLEKLTKEQEELMFQTRDEWINRFFHTTNINKKEFEKGINWLYQDLLKKKKPKILYCESWLEALVTITVLKDNNVRANVMANVGENVRENVGDNVMKNVRDNVVDNVMDNVVDNVRDNVMKNVWDNVGANIWVNVGANVGENVGENVVEDVWDNVVANVWANVVDNVGANVRANVGENVRASVRANVVANVWANVVDNVVDNVWANVRDNVRDNVMENVRGYSNYTNTYSNFGWVSFYDYFEKIGIFRNEQFIKYKNLIKSGAFQVYEHDNYVFAIQPPKKMKVNDQGRLNCLEDKAFEWGDGYGFYFINGFSVGEDLFIKLKNKEVTLEYFLKQDNEEVKSAIISYIQQSEGEEGIYRLFKKHLKETDSYIDKKEDKYLEGTTKGMNIGVYTLFKGNINNIKIAYVRCYCPSTDRMFFLGVDPKHNNVKDAIASLYRVPKVLKDNIVEIYRQGEIFSTRFTDDVHEKLKNNNYTKEEIGDLVSISGEEYFSKIKYEY